ncbi:hypothetical protein Droror1_Dr00012507 [Drosera rotundifolia]
MWSRGEGYPCAIAATSSSSSERGEGTGGLGQAKGIEQKSVEVEAVVLVSGWGMRRREGGEGGGRAAAAEAAEAAEADSCFVAVGFSWSWLMRMGFDLFRYFDWDPWFEDGNCCSCGSSLVVGVLFGVCLCFVEGFRPVRPCEPLVGHCLAELLLLFVGLPSSELRTLPARSSGGKRRLDDGGQRRWSAEGRVRARLGLGLAGSGSEEVQQRAAAMAWLWLAAEIDGDGVRVK